MKTTYEHWEVQRELQRQEAQVLQLQQVQSYGKGMLIGKEETRNTNVFQM